MSAIAPADATQSGDEAVFMDAAAFPTTMLNAIVAPRPIGWISTVAADGRVNLAPFSYFNAIAASPAMLLFSCNKPPDRDFKDTARNVRETGEFVFNYASYALREAMNRSSAPLPHGADEFEFAGLAKAPSRIVRPPRVADAPANLECKVVQIVELDPNETGRTTTTLVIGRVVGVHIRPEFLDANGRFDSRKAAAIARAGGVTYVEYGSQLQMERPPYP